jgi:hypothetical protein
VVCGRIGARIARVSIDRGYRRRLRRLGGGDGLPAGNRLPVAGIVPAGRGNGGAGSPRVPAACCGAFSIKPTRGRFALASDARCTVGHDH